MGDRKKTKAQLLQELEALGQRLAALEMCALGHLAGEPLPHNGRDLASAVLDTADALVVVLDTQGRIVRFNRACEKTTGYSFAEVCGKCFWNLLLIPEEVAPVRKVFEQLRAGQFPNKYENFWVARDGSRRLIAWSNTALLDDSGSVRYVIATGLDITARKAAEEELRHAHDELERHVAQRTAELAQANQRLKQDIAEREQVEELLQEQQQLLRRLLDLQEKERKLVAYEIHDGFAQLATAALLHLQSVSALWHQDPAKAEESLQTGLRLLGDGIAEARRLISGLRPPILDESGIVAALQCLAAESPAPGGPQVEFVCQVQPDRLAPQLESGVFRIVQEALTNARRHSHSDKVRLILRQQNGRIRIEVQDWGVGFEPAKVAEGHFGLEGIRQRARLLGGRADIHSAPGQGTRVTVEIPLLPSLPDSPPAAPP